LHALAEGNRLWMMMMMITLLLVRFYRTAFTKKLCYITDRMMLM
jgi:hypothetical protein